MSSLRSIEPISNFAFSKTPGTKKLITKMRRLIINEITIKPIVVGSLKNLKLMYAKAAAKTVSREIMLNVSILCLCFEAEISKIENLTKSLSKRINAEVIVITQGNEGSLVYDNNDFIAGQGCPFSYQVFESDFTQKLAEQADKITDNLNNAITKLFTPYSPYLTSFSESVASASGRFI